jgi:hypothetical protein
VASPGPSRVEDGDEEHRIVGVVVHPVEDRQFAISFEVECGRTLRLRMPWDRLADLGKALLDLAEERRLAGDL